LTHATPPRTSVSEPGDPGVDAVIPKADNRAPLWRLILARVLVVLGVILIAVTILAGYLRWQLFDEGTFNGTTSELIASDAVRNELAGAAAEQLLAHVDAQGDLERVLPANTRQYAGLVSIFLPEFVNRASERLLARPRVQALLRRELARAHEQLLRVLRDETTVLQQQGGEVVLDLRPLILRIGERIEILGNVVDTLPPDAGRVRIMEARRLERAQDVTSLFEKVALWIWVVPLALWAAAIWLARGRRRIEVRAIAIGLVIAGFLVLIARGLAGGYVVDELVTASETKEAAEQAWEIVTGLLADGAWAVISIGLGALVGVWLAGPTRSGTAARRWLAPVLARPFLTYGVLAFLYLLFIWWAPYAQARRTIYLLVAGALLVIGVEALRRLTAREFPGAASIQPRELVRAPAALRRRAPAPSPAEELERLARLREQGILDDEELAAAKARVLQA
jgi:hypothetical protein